MNELEFFARLVKFIPAYFFCSLTNTQTLVHVCNEGSRSATTFYVCYLSPSPTDGRVVVCLLKKTGKKRLAKIGTESVVQQHYCTVLRKGKRENSFLQMLCLTSGERALLSASNRVLFAPDKGSPGTLQKKEYFDSSLM